MSRSMKDSGVAWIGEIPKEWKISRIKNLFELRNERSYEALEDVNLISLYTDKGVVQHSDLTETTGNKAVNADGYKIVKENDIVVNIILCWMGAVGRSDYNGVTSPAYDVYKPYPNTNSKYFHYLFRTPQFNGECYRYGRGIMMMRWRTYSTEFKAINIPIPSTKEQQRIVDMLDKKCSEVNTLIANQHKQIEKLKQYKQSLITEIVTKGLNSDVEMKYSDVEWIEKIPSDWSVHTLKGVFSFSKGLPITKADLVEKGTAVISYGQIHAKYNCSTHVDERLLRYVPDTFAETHPQCFVKKEDFIFADTSEDVAGSGDFVYIDTDEPIFAGYHTIVLKPKKEQKNRYLAYLFMSDMWKKQIQCRVSGVKLFSISRGILGKVSYILPPEKEQEEISNFLEDKCRQIDRLISIKQQKIDKLNQYKKSIIYEYVTGKKEA